MLRSRLAVGAVVLCFAACTEENTNMQGDTGGTGDPDGAVADASAGLDGADVDGGPGPGLETGVDGPAADAPGPGPEAGVDGPVADAPGSPDMPGSPDLAKADLAKADLAKPDLLAPDLVPPPDIPAPVDVGPGGCVTNADCKFKSQFCLLPVGCTPPGTCQKKPKACPYLYDPVCGCDNKDYANSCLAYTAGISVKHKGTCTSGTTCVQIRTDYKAAVAAAKQCSPMRPTVQCVTVVTKDLACGCDTAVNKHSTAYPKVTALQSQWTAQSCHKQPWPCPAIPCQPVSTGKCDANTGKCVDLP